MRKKLFRTCLALLASTSLTASVQAEVKLPGFVGSHMVLQQSKPIPLWGWANPGEVVTATLGEESVSTTTGADGRWRLEFPARTASHDPIQLQVVGENTLSFDDILIGEVWLCSGQSNMEWTVAISANAQEEIQNGNHPLIRQIAFAKQTASSPQDDISSTWQVASPETVGSFTAVGYYMARNLQQELNVPVGLINSSWGGTLIEPWTPPVGFADVPELKTLSQYVEGKNPESSAYQNRFKTYLEAVQTWEKLAQGAADAKTFCPPVPVFPGELNPLISHGDPTAIYNAMIHPLVGWPIRGAIWYQGESNASEGMLYRAKMEALIQGWRKIWGQGDFPFYFVQIAPYNYGHLASHKLAELWEAQNAATEIPNTGVAVINDISNLNDIHPANKQDVGLRLALLALNRTYGKEGVVDSGPTLNLLEARDHELIVHFANTAGGLKTRDGKAPDWFEVIGEGTGWKKADAQIDGETIVLTSSEVPKPVAMRFAWHMLAEPNLVNGAGLPASAFRSGTVPVADFLGSIEAAKGFQLALDLDLNDLSAEPIYEVDHRAELTGEIEKIGYLLELQKDDGNPHYVFTSMDAFTNEIGKVGIPTAKSGAVFQQLVKNLTVVSNVEGVQNVTDVQTGNLEFWPHNYGPRNGNHIPDASETLYDFGDFYSEPVNGHGSMQVHNHGSKQTVFAINNWKSGAAADIGIGNFSGAQPDWTFAGNGQQYSHKRLRVFVKLK